MIGVCPNCGSAWEGSEEDVNEGFGNPRARWCPDCFRSRQYRFDLECPVCNKQAEMTTDRRELSVAGSLVCCKDCYRGRGELVAMRVRSAEVLDG
jgi:hypothetical protein